jgi:hypothetical protein
LQPDLAGGAHAVDEYYLDPAQTALSLKPVAPAGKVEYEAFGQGVTFSTPVAPASAGG